MVISRAKGALTHITKRRGCDTGTPGARQWGYQHTRGNPHCRCPHGGRETIRPGQCTGRCQRTHRHPRPPHRGRTHAAHLRTQRGDGDVRGNLGVPGLRHHHRLQLKAQLTASDPTTKNPTPISRGGVFGSPGWTRRTRHSPENPSPPPPPKQPVRTPVVTGTTSTVIRGKGALPLPRGNSGKFHPARQCSPEGATTHQVAPSAHPNPTNSSVSPSPPYSAPRVPIPHPRR
jgi:hypothetical protein